MKPFATTLLLAIPICGLLSWLNQNAIHKNIPLPSAQNHFWVEKTFTDQAFDMVLMGDSRTYNALSPALLEEVMPGMRVLNFGYADGGFNPLMFQAAERKFAPDAKSKTLVLGITPNSLTPKKGALNLRYLEQKAKRPDFIFGNLYLSGLLRHFDSMEPAFFIDAFFNATVFIEREYHPLGWMAETWTPARPQQQIPIFKEKFRGNAVSPAIESTLVEQVRRWSKSGYVVLGYRPPNTSEMFALEDAISGFDYSRFISLFEAAGGRWLRPDTSALVSFDGSHLDKPSAVAFSRRMGGALREIMPGK